PLATVRDFYRDLPRYRGEAQRVVGAAARGGQGLALDALTPAVPVPETAKVICVAVNYKMHADETGSDLPDRPNLFARWWATLVASGTPVPVPVDEPGLDWEVELAVVMGAPLSAPTPAAQAPGAVLGYTVFNDVSARTHQRATTQWANGKNADQSGPIGSHVVTPDELDVADLRLRTTVNDAVMQDGSTAEMAIKIPDLIAYATRTISLRPGDVIATGTPAGVGFRRDPPVLMHPGDTCTVEIEGIGAVRTPIVDASQRH
ncbi:MAG TPA: fumarylacetoacetate hydrolase family protein, partial [Acidimicrobiales bacterium]|nr:fumarylacetoacetate hydrolase family protein [Acidimicrobiales bacterium]